MDELCTGATAKNMDDEDDDLEAIKFAPHPSNYILAYNGIFDNKTKQFHPVGSKKYLELTDTYTFLNNPTF